MDKLFRFNVVFSLALAFTMIFMIVSFLLFDQPVNEWIYLITAEIKSRYTVWALALFLIATLAFDIILPIPSSVIAVVAATSLGFWGGSAVIWIGLMLGCCAGYSIGSGSAHYLFKRFVSQQETAKAQRLASTIGPGTLIALRGVPVLAETSVISAGMIRFPFIPFLFICGLTNAGLALTYGYIGAQAGVTQSFLLILAGCIAVPGSAWMLNWLFNMLKNQYHKFTSKKNHKTKCINASLKLSLSYPVLFENEVFDSNNTALRNLLVSKNRKTQTVWVVLDSGLNEAAPDLIGKIQQYFFYHQDQLQLVSTPSVISGGENAKQQKVIESLYQQMLDHNLDRHSCAIIIGGGALLDAAGFACSTFHRGIQYIRMPTTVLGQNDAGVGVKNGFNYLNVKNLIGTFSTPVAVINDASLLNFLSDRDKRAGLAEAIKVAVIRDADFFLWLEQKSNALSQFDKNASQYAIARCAELHVQQITQGGDPFETDNARPLDYGHWCAHKIEAMSHYQLRHGEAVAIGMALDALYAVNIGMLDVNSCNRLVGLLEKLGFVLWHESLHQLDKDGLPLLFSGLEEFRQHLGGKLCITLLSEIGIGKEVHSIDKNALLDSLNWLHHRTQKQIISTRNSQTTPTLPPLAKGVC